MSVKTQDPVGLSQYRNAVASGRPYQYGPYQLHETRRYRVSVLTETHWIRSFYTASMKWAVSDEK